MAFLKGLILGLGTAMFLGPVFFTLIKNSIQRGKIAGIATALGILFSDIVVIAICFYSTASLLESIKSDPIVKWAGAAVLLGLGLRYIISPVKFNPDSNGGAQVRKRDLLGYFTQGVLVNGVNPFVFVVWIGFLALGRDNFEGNQLYVFIIGILVGILSTDTLKALLAHRIRPLLTNRHLTQASRLIGIVLIGFAFRLILYALGMFT